jgi:hypothetical protein
MDGVKLEVEGQRGGESGKTSVAMVAFGKTDRRRTVNLS